MQISKKELTDCLLAKNTDTPYLELWAAPYSTTSLQLSDAGFIFLSIELEVQFYRHKVFPDLPTNCKTILLLSKYLHSPFFIVDKTEILLFGAQDSVMLTLSNNNLLQFLENQA